MKTQQQVASSIIQQAYIGLIITSMILVLLAAITTLNLTANIHGVMAGVITAVLLLAYWQGKGGSYFILALMSPLAMVVLTELPDFMVLLQTILAYFLGLSLILTLFRLFKTKR